MATGPVAAYSIDWLAERYYEYVIIDGITINAFVDFYVPWVSRSAVSKVLCSAKFKRILYALHPEINPTISENTSDIRYFVTLTTPHHDNLSNQLPLLRFLAKYHSGISGD